MVKWCIAACHISPGGSYLIRLLDLFSHLLFWFAFVTNFVCLTDFSLFVSWIGSIVQFLNIVFFKMHVWLLSYVFTQLTDSRTVCTCLQSCIQKILILQFRAFSNSLIYQNLLLRLKVMYFEGVVLTSLYIKVFL